MRDFVKRSFFFPLVFLAGLGLFFLRTPHAQAEPHPGWLGVAMIAGKPGSAGNPGSAGGADETGKVGVEVQRVVRGSPAAKAGLQLGDRIVRVDGGPVSIPEDVTRRIRLHGAGDKARVEVIRGGVHLKLVAALTPAPSPQDVLRMEHLGQPLRPWQSLTPVHGVFPSRSDALQGRVAVIEFWATWCGPCRVTGPVLDRWQRELGAEGLSVFGISAESPETVALHGVRAGTHFGLASDAEGVTTRDYGISSLPTLFVIDRQGVVREITVGFDPERLNKTEALLRTLLAEPAPSP